jgi:hypothetical protein
MRLRWHQFFLLRQRRMFKGAAPFFKNTTCFVRQWFYNHTQPYLILFVIFLPISEQIPALLRRVNRRSVIKLKRWQKNHSCF